MCVPTARTGKPAWGGAGPLRAHPLVGHTLEPAAWPGLASLPPLSSPARTTAHMAATVDALLPLSFLEAVRAVDRPIDDPDTEFVDELRNKRLGLSDTVQAQIRRYSDLVRRGQRLGADEAAGIARLIGRRPDAEAVFRAAGRYLARQAYGTLAPSTRRIAGALPGLLARPLVLRQVRRLARRYFGGTVRRVGSALLLEVPKPITVPVAPLGAGCAYYEASFRELLRLLVRSEGAVEHVSCSARAEGRCEWRAEWRR